MPKSAHDTSDPVAERPVQLVRYMSVPNAASYTSLSKVSIRRLLASGKLTALRPVRGRVLIDKFELDAFVLGSTAVPRRRRGEK